MLSWADDKAVPLVEKMRRGSPRSDQAEHLRRDGLLRPQFETYILCSFQSARSYLSDRQVQIAPC